MRTFQTWWLKLSCFLTGYNFYILSACSEVSVRKVKKYTSALIIIFILWAFVGYFFCSRYIKLGPLASLSGSLISVLIILQIERQILLIEKTNTALKYTRFALAFLMAIIGSLIIDQIIFKDDIESAKMITNQQKVALLMPTKTSEIASHISSLNQAIITKENERKSFIEDISKNPNQQILETTISVVPVNKTIKDSLKTETTNTILKKVSTTNVRSIPNPKIEQIPGINQQLKDLNQQKTDKENMLITLKSDLENEVKSKVGFLDELSNLVNIIKGSLIACVVYFIWFIFLLLIELLVLIGKSNDTDSDYEKAIQKQMEIHMTKIHLL